MRKTLLLCSLFIAVALNAEMTQSDYQRLNNKSGEASILETLNAIISDHNDVGYDGLYTVYRTSDSRADGTVWDMYSDCAFAHSKTCGSYSTVCNCFNREHSVPQSWFSGSHMKSDAFHVYPTDGYVNNQRGNHPFGECSGGTYLSSKARGKLGQSTFSGYSGLVFEPDDEYKGDFARSYFYMVACYYKNNMSKSEGSAMFTYNGGKAGLTDYAVRLLMKWHRLDPVSEKEIARNNAVYEYQKNRNPFIDYPCLAEYIWGDKKGQKIEFDNLSECETTQNPDTTNHGEQPKEFTILPVTDIHALSVVLHWTDAGVSDYIIDVYQVVEPEDDGDQSSSEPVTLLFDEMDGETKAKTEGYTSLTDQTGAIRLGSGSNTGTLTYGGLNLSADGYVRVKAKAYGSDSEPVFAVQCGQEKQQFTATADYVDYVFNYKGSTETTITIYTNEKKKRIYIDEVEIVAGSGGKAVAQKQSLQGYPRSVGQVLQHKVEGLESNTQYFYTVQPQGMETSEEHTFVTEEGWDGFDFVAFPTVQVYAAGNKICLTGLEQYTTVSIYSANGTIVNRGAVSEKDMTVAAPSGLYFVIVSDQKRMQTYKVIVN